MPKLKEIWKPIPGYEGLYEASHIGNIKSCLRKVWKDNCFITINESILKKGLNKEYHQVKLYTTTGKKTIKVHRLIAITFKKNHKNKPTVNHKNGIKTDNHVRNLEWATRSEQSIHAYENGLKLPIRGTSHSLAKLTETAVIDIRASYSTGNITQIELAKKYGVHYSKISRVILKKDWSHVG